MAEEKKEPEEKKKSGLMKKLLMGVVALVVLVGAMSAGFMVSSSNILGNLMGGKEEKASGETGQGGEGEGAPSLQIGPMLDIDSFIVNILDEEGTHYLKASITLEVDNPLTLDEINQRMPQIRDNILLQVGNKTFKELADLEGKLQLRAELVSSLNGILETGEVKKIFFTDFVVQ